MLSATRPVASEYANRRLIFRANPTHRGYDWLNRVQCNGEMGRYKRDSYVWYPIFVVR